MKSQYFWRGACLLVLGLASVMVGCRREAAVQAPPHDFHVLVQDAQGVGAGSAVQWRGLDVGRVDSVRMEQGGVRIDVRLHPDYQGVLREGVRARPVKGFLGRGAVALELYGGDDTRKATLRQGSVIPEASLADGISPAQMKLVAIFLIGALLVLSVLHIMKRMLAFALALALVVFSGWFFYRQWDQHGEQFQAASMEMEWSEMARTLLTEDAAQQAWLAVQTDLAEALREVGGHGRERVAAATAEVRAELEAKAVSLAEEGKKRASQEIRRLITGLSEQEPDEPKPESEELP